MPVLLDTAQLNSGQLEEHQLQKHAYRKSRIVNYTLDDVDLETQCPLDNGRHSVRPRHSVSQLDKLPLEILIEIFLALDLPTLTAFRRVNHRAMLLVDSIYQYRMVLKHVPNVLRDIVSINARAFDCRTLYETLSSTKCATCDCFGGYLYLITCKRVCYMCFVYDLNYFPVSSRYAAQQTGLKLKELKRRLPYVSSLPGRYSFGGRMVKNRTLLFDRRSMVKRLRHGHVHTSGETIQQLDRKTSEPRRYMTIITAPYFTSSGQSADWGYFCERCRPGTDIARLRAKFTRDGILEHIRQHEVNDD
ncbi:hypothetical protein EV127DRAFT_465703 [Xylaria flabelliformis]|nr:hypothetical protein EV127DRAFT_465703 [Xylaria flabelliformis]